MKSINSKYTEKKYKIKKRLREFKKTYKRKNSDLFAELCFCILTPQSKAVFCDKAIERLKKHNLLFRGSAREIRNNLKGLVRFHNKKASYLVAARKTFMKGKEFNIKNNLDESDILKTRHWLINNIKGLGYKEASHFLRNIGLGKDISILDVHILKNLKRLGVIREIPKSVGKKTYTYIEEKMRKFAKKARIPLEELDLLFWSNETGFVFK